MVNSLGSFGRMGWSAVKTNFQSFTSEMWIHVRLWIQLPFHNNYQPCNTQTGLNRLDFVFYCLTPDDFTHQWGTPGSQWVKWVDHWNKESNGIVVLALSEELPLRFLCGSHIFCGVLFCLKGYLGWMLFLGQCRSNYNFLKSQDVTHKLLEHCYFCDVFYDQTRQPLHQKIGEHFRPRFLVRYF